MGLYLMGNAPSYFHCPEAATRIRTFAHFVAAFEQRFGDATLVPTFHAELQARKQTQGEPLSGLSEQIRKLTCRSYPALAPQVQDIQARDAFVSGLNSRELGLHVRGIDPGTLNEAI